MKKLKVLGLAAAAAGMVLLTSCMDGNNEYSNTLYGVVDPSIKTGFKKIVYPEAYYPISLPSVENDFTIEEGDCVYVNFKVETDSPENKNAATNGYYAASGTVLQVLKPNQMDLMLSDTTTVGHKEMLFKDAGIRSLIQSENYMYLMVGAIPTTYLKNQKANYDLTCDIYQEPQKIENTERVYTLFLRATKIADGESPAIEGGGDMLAFDVKTFYERLSDREKAEGKDKIYFTIKYPAAFNEDSTKVTEWKSIEPVYLSVIADKE